MLPLRRYLAVAAWLAAISALLAPTGRAQARSASTPAPTNIPPLRLNLDKTFKLNRKEHLSGRVAFVAFISNFERIFVLDLDNHQVRALVDGPGRNSAPAWSPEGDRLAFSSTRDGNKKIYICDYEGENQQRLTDGNANDDRPDWHPNGQSLIFDSTRENGSKTQKRINLWSIKANGKDLKRITNFKGQNFNARFSPDGSKVAYVTNRFWPGTDICIWNFKQGLERCPLKGSENYQRPLWSPKGNALAYLYGFAGDLNVAILHFKGETEETFAPHHAAKFDMAWDPSSGKRMIFIHQSNGKLPFSIRIYRMDQKESVPLLESPYLLRYLSWSKTTTMALEAARAKELGSHTESLLQKNGVE